MQKLTHLGITPALGFLAFFTLSVADPPPAAVPQSGAITGVIRFTGKVPAAEKIVVSDGTTIQHSDLVVDAKSQGLRDVVVALSDAPAQPNVKNVKPVLVDQRDWIFKPRVVGVRHGQEVRFDNNDAVNHSVQAFSFEKANEFNATAGPGTPVIHAFVPQKDPILIGCSLHAWMKAWVFVFEHPWFAVTDEQGKFRIDNIPPGKYTLAWVHPDTNLREKKSIEVEGGKTLELSHEWKEVKKEE